MVVIKTGMSELPQVCEECRYYGVRPHPYDGWMDLCELCGERIDADGCKDDGWCYDGEKGLITVHRWRFPMKNRDRLIEALRGTASMKGRRRYE